MKKAVKVIMSLVVALSIMLVPQYGCAKTKSTIIHLSEKNVFSNSEITRTSASGTTGNDGWIKVKVTSTYICAVNGKQKKPVTSSKLSYSSIAQVGFKAVNNGISLSVSSSHYASYAGSTGTGHIAVAY